MAGRRGLGALPRPQTLLVACLMYACITFSMCIQWVGGWMFFLLSMELERVPGEASAASNHFQRELLNGLTLIAPRSKVRTQAGKLCHQHSGLSSIFFTMSHSQKKTAPNRRKIGCIIAPIHPVWLFGSECAWPQLSGSWRAGPGKLGGGQAQNHASTQSWENSGRRGPQDNTRHPSKSFLIPKLVIMIL